MKPHLLKPTDLYAPGALQALLEFHRATFGDATMTVTPPEGSGGTSTGTEGAGGTSTPPAPSQGAGGAPTPPEKVLPQSRVNEIVAAETQKAKDKAISDLVTEFGMSLEDAKALLKSTKEANDAKKSEELKRAEAAERERDEAKTSAATAAQDLFNARADRALIAAGADDNDEALARLRGLFQVKPGATPDEIKADAKKVAEQFPALFTGTAPGKRPLPHGDPRTGHRRQQGESTGIQRGLERAQQSVRPTGTDGKPTGAVIKIAGT